MAEWKILTWTIAIKFIIFSCVDFIMSSYWKIPNVINKWNLQIQLYLSLATIIKIVCCCSVSNKLKPCTDKHVAFVVSCRNRNLQLKKWITYAQNAIEMINVLSICYRPRKTRTWKIRHQRRASTFLFECKNRLSSQAAIVEAALWLQHIGQWPNFAFILNNLFSCHCQGWKPTNN